MSSKRSLELVRKVSMIEPTQTIGLHDSAADLEAGTLQPAGAAHLYKSLTILADSIAFLRWMLVKSLCGRNVL